MEYLQYLDLKNHQLNFVKNQLNYQKSKINLINRIRHRGPDWSGVKVIGENVLCHERLAIVGVGNLIIYYDL